jgi:hypothetical protein
VFLTILQSKLQIEERKDKAIRQQAKDKCISRKTSKGPFQEKIPKWPINVGRDGSVPGVIREVQIKTTMRSHFTPIRLATIKKADNT